MNSPYNLQPAYAPYGQPYVPPRYPLVSLVGQQYGLTPAEQAAADAARATPTMATTTTMNPLTQEFWRERTLGIPRWALGAGTVALLTIAGLWSSGMLDGGRRGARRDPGIFSLGRDPARKRRRAGGGRGRQRRDPAFHMTSGTKKKSRSDSYDRDPARKRRRRSGGGRGRRDFGFGLDF